MKEALEILTALDVEMPQSKKGENSYIALNSRMRSVSEGVSSKTLSDMDKAIENFKKGKVSAPIDLSDF